MRKISYKPQLRDILQYLTSIPENCQGRQKQYSLRNCQSRRTQGDINVMWNPGQNSTVEKRY